MTCADCLYFGPAKYWDEHYGKMKECRQHSAPLLIAFLVPERRACEKFESKNKEK